MHAEQDCTILSVFSCAIVFEYANSELREWERYSVILQQISKHISFWRNFILLFKAEVNHLWYIAPSPVSSDTLPIVEMESKILISISPAIEIWPARIRTHFRHIMVVVLPSFAFPHPKIKFIVKGRWKYFFMFIHLFSSKHFVQRDFVSAYCVWWF